MPTTCTATHGCSITCPGDCCWAIYWHEYDRCDAGCCNENVETLRSRLAVGGTGESKVSFCAKEMELSQLGVILDSLLPDQIAIPAAGAHTKISMELPEVPIGEVVKSLGLLTL